MMTEQEARNLFMDYLYDEMGDEKKQVFEEFLKNHPELRAELNELESTRSLLQNVPVPAPSHNLVMITPAGRGSESGSGKKKMRKQDKKILFSNRTLAVAAVFLASLLLFSFAELNVGKTESGFYFAFGEPPVQEPSGMSEDEVLGMIEQIRSENALLLDSMFEQVQAHQTEQLEQVQVQQNEQFEEALNVLAAYYERQRQQDLQLISEGFVQLEEETNNRFSQTNEALGGIIYALSNPE